MKLIFEQAGRRFWFLQLVPPYTQKLPAMESPFVAILLACDNGLSAVQQAEVSAQLIARECRYVLAWGHHASSWDDSVDMAFLASDPEYDPPQNRQVMTSWHDFESISDVVWLARNSTNFDKHHFQNYLALMIGANQAIEAELMAAIEGL